MGLRRLKEGAGGGVALAILVIGLGLFAFAIGARMLSEYDLPWHLATGRQIVDQRAIPTVDSFSFAHPDMKYLSVLSDVILYGLMAAGGPLALQIFGAAMAVAVALILVARALEHGVAGVAIAALGLFAMHLWLIVRPATLTFVFAAALLGLIELHRRQPTTRRGRGALIAALAMIPLWANSHGGAIFAVMVLLLYAGHRTLATLFSARLPNLLPGTDRGALALSWGVALLAPLLALVNPAGIEYFSGVSEVAPYAKYISEWSPTSVDYFIHVVPAAGAFLALSAIILLLGREPSGSRVPPLYLIALVGGAFALTTVMRFVPLAIVVLVPIVARRMGRLAIDTALARGLLASTLAISGVSILGVDPTTRGIGMDPKSFPEAAVTFVEETGLKGNMWNFWPYGGYLIWRLYPQHLVALDGRFGLVTYDREYAMRVLESGTQRPPFQQLVRDWDIQWAFCYARANVRRSCEPVARDPAWAMIYWDDHAAIYVRKDGVNGQLAASGYRVLRHLMQPDDVLDLVMRGVQRDDFSHDGALARAQAPASTRALFFDAVGAVAANDEPRFSNALHALGDIAPYHPALPVLVDLLSRIHHGGAPPPPPQSP